MQVGDQERDRGAASPKPEAKLGVPTADDTELAATAAVSGEAAAVTRDAVAEHTALAPQTPDDETTILADETATELAKALAWSDTEAGPTEPAPYVERRAGWRWAIAVAAVALPLVTIAALGIAFLRGKNHDRPIPPVATSTLTPAPRTTPAIAPLNGLYRLVMDYPHQTSHDLGDLGPSGTPVQIEYWRFTTTCDTSCTAHGVRLNHDTGQPVADLPGHKPSTITLTYTDSAWRQLAPDTNGSIACPTGERAQFSDSWQFTPAASDGMLQGTDTSALPLGACGRNAIWIQTPLHLERA